MSHVKKATFIPVIFFLVCVLLALPLAWPRIFLFNIKYWGEVALFTPSLLALLAFAFILFYPEKLLSFIASSKIKIPLVSFIVIIFVAFLQIYFCYNYHLIYIFTVFACLFIPLFCALNWKTVEKYLPYIVLILAVANTIQIVRELPIRGEFSYGLTGNWNWSASLQLIFLPFLIYLLFKYFPKRKITNFSVYGIYFVFLVFYIVFCNAKATALALSIATCFIVILIYWKKLSIKSWCRLGFFSIIVVLAVVLFYKNQILHALSEDQRIYLWQAALELIKNNFWIGSGPVVFESAYAPYFSSDYYMGAIAAVRHPHAHNFILQFAASMGIPALLAWLGLLIFAFVKNLPKAIGRKNWELKVLYFVFVALIVHMMFDVVDSVWPLSYIFLIVLGILLGRAVGFGDKEKKDIKFHVIVGFKVAGILVLCIFFYLSYENLLSSYYFRKTRILLDQGLTEAAYSEIEKSIKYRQTPENTYAAAQMAFYDKKEPKLCLMYLEKLESLGFENFEHNNLLKAKALVVCGKLKESLVYFAQEQQNYPLSCVNLHYYSLILGKLGEKQKSVAIRKHMYDLMKIKGFNKEQLPMLLKNPYFDLRFREYKEDIK